MAIDTEAKRRGKVPPLWVLPLADGAIGQSDRQHKGFKYPGILSTEAAVATFRTIILAGESGYTIEVQSRNYTLET